jgi:4-hydroxy 2-oxovalerate aldolase
MTKLYDVTLRDGNHALRHQLTTKFVTEYCKKADEAGLYAVEVGHGNGLGASSYLIGKSAESDLNLLEAARNNLNNTRLAVHTIPGIATIGRDLIPALESGVEIFRVATHCTEASIAEKHIEFLAINNVIVHGVLMMSHMNSINGLISQAVLMKKFGASAVILMDSAGYFIPEEVKIRVDAIKNSVDIDVGFHAHNNQGVAVTNAFEAIMAGASIIDGASMGLGAGAGNAQLENIVSNGLRNSLINSNLKHFLELSTLTEQSFPNNLPRITSSSIQSGMSGVFSGFAPHVKALSEELGIESTELWDEIGKRKLVAGQESMIREVAQDLMNL